MCIRDSCRSSAPPCACDSTPPAPPGAAEPSPPSAPNSPPPRPATPAPTSPSPTASKATTSHRSTHYVRSSGLRQARAFGHLRPRPVRRVRRCGLQGGHHHVLDLVCADHRRTTRARLIHEPVEPELDEPGPPLAHRDPRTSQPGGDRLVVHAARLG